MYQPLHTWHTELLQKHIFQLLVSLGRHLQIANGQECVWQCQGKPKHDGVLSAIEIYLLGDFFLIEMPYEYWGMHACYTVKTKLVMSIHRLKFYSVFLLYEKVRVHKKLAEWKIHKIYCFLKELQDLFENRKRMINSYGDWMIRACINNCKGNMVIL